MAKKNLGDTINNISGTAGAIIGGVQAVGSLFQNKGNQERKQDERQLAMQRKLNTENAKTNKELADYEQKLKMQMWHDTNYTAQLSEAEKAGVSKAHVLGGGGSGVGMGASVDTAGIGSGASGAVQGQLANLQTEMQKAQIANLNANTEKTKVEAEVTGGVGKEKIGQETANLKLEADWKTISNKIANETVEDAISSIKWEAQRQLYEQNKAGIESKIAEETQSQQIQQIKDQATITAIEKIARQQGVYKTKAEIKAINEQIKQGWKSLEVAEKGQAVSAENADKMMKAILGGAGINAIGNVVRGIIDIKSMGKKPKGHHKEKGKTDKEGNTTYEWEDLSPKY